jgi:hypothetical protein
MCTVWPPLSTGPSQACGTRSESLDRGPSTFVVIEGTFTFTPLGSEDHPLAAESSLANTFCPS